jgi:hypothetical protein
LKAKKKIEDLLHRSFRVGMDFSIAPLLDTTGRHRHQETGYQTILVELTTEAAGQESRLNATSDAHLGLPTIGGRAEGPA